MSVSHKFFIPKSIENDLKFKVIIKVMNETKNVKEQKTLSIYIRKTIRKHEVKRQIQLEANVKRMQ